MTSISIALMPFQVLGEAPEQECFAAGFHEDLVVELSRFPSLRVLSGPRESGAETVAETGESSDTEGAAPYRVTGSIRREGDRLRVTAQLVSTESGEHLWAERFDAGASDSFTVQDEIASAVAGTLASRIDGILLHRSRRTPMTNLAAYECCLRGRECLEAGTVEADMEARSYYHRAIELDPHYARAYAGLSLAYYNDWSCQSWHLWAEGERKAEEYATKALALDDGDPLVHVVLGRVELYGREFEKAARHFDRALALNPNDKDVLAHVALWKFYLGQCEQAHELAIRSMELDPLHGAWLHGLAGLPLYTLERYDESHDLMAKAGPAFIDFPAVQAAAAARAGRDAEAAKALAVFRREYENKVAFGRKPEPGEPMRWLIQVNPFRRPEDLERLLEGLRMAGLEDSIEGTGAIAMSCEVVPPGLVSQGNRFEKEGDLWSVCYDGVGAKLVEVKGFHDLRVLLDQPGQAVHCLELTGATASSSDVPVLDPEAKWQFQERLRSLESEIDEAERFQDLGRAQKARAERDELAVELGRALGLGGRSRKLGDPAERARSAVTWRIRSAIKKVAAAHPRLGLHLSNSIRTGLLCQYTPEQETTWD